MEFLHDATLLQIYVWCYLLLVGSALLPWLNSEVVMLALTPLVPTFPAQLVLVLLATAGQMTGKCVLYWAGRGLVHVPGAADRVQSWQEKWKGRRMGSAAVLFFSSTFGVPPFYPVSFIAGGLAVSFVRFVLVGACGRFLHYSAVVFPAGLLH